MEHHGLTVVSDETKANQLSYPGPLRLNQPELNPPTPGRVRPNGRWFVSVLAGWSAGDVEERDKC